MDIQINFSTENLHSFSDLVEVLQNDNGKVNKYHLSLDDLLQILSSASTGDRDPSPFLPRNCIRYIKKSSGNEVFVDIPKQKWMINFNGNMFEVGFPRLIFSYDCSEYIKSKEKKYSVTISRIFAVKGKEHITSKTQLFQFPYSHVQTNGNVCMGGNKLGDIACLSELATKHNMFFHSPFSTDYGAKTKLGKNIAELFSAEFNQKEFNDEVLISTNSTFSELFGITE
ncbi:prokaryotic E2 ligase family D protein [Metabacillus halosaccharovorans]|uniref:prokaryotic E2 ligase family D protein n=1 Tax=Metabacillus halosaccharovorans TaxID=930124 RepID=UPI001C1F6D14|nr:prokaryotic E2 ligase family D protein [Metabacillus halosaccharovorans]MBU7595909.1 hypothetical protein [Metabacillus halosaccharovorans]